MKRSTLIVLAVAFLTLVAVPVQAGDGSSGNRDGYEIVWASFEEGNLGYELYGSGDSYTWVFLRGEFGEAFQCGSDGPADEIPLPEAKRTGLDTVKLSLSVPKEAFQYCNGWPPDIVTYDIVLKADSVTRLTRNETMQVLVGEGSSWSSHRQELTGFSEWGPDAVTGTIAGKAITEGTIYYQFTDYSSNN